VAALTVELAYVAFVSLGLPALLGERARAAGFDLDCGQVFGFVPGRLHVDDLRIATSTGRRISLHWRRADVHLNLFGLVRGKLVLARFSGNGLTVSAFSAATPRNLAVERDDSLESRPAIAKARASTSALVASKGLRIVRLESGVERMDVDRFRFHGIMRLRANSVVLGAGTLRAERVVLDVDGVGVFREAVRLAKQLNGRVSLAVTRLNRGRVRGDWDSEIRGKLTFRASQPSLDAFPALAGFSLHEGAVASAEIDVDPSGVRWTARLASPAGARWVGLAGAVVSFEETVALTASRRNPVEPPRVELSVPILRTDCRSPAFCVEMVERLTMTTAARLDGESWNGASHEVEIHSGPARLRVAGRTLEAQTVMGSLSAAEGDEGASLLVDQGMLVLRRIHWRSSNGPRPLARSATLNIDEGLLSRDMARARGSVRAEGSDAGVLVALAPLPWLRTMLSGVAGKPYSFDGNLRFEPGTFELEDARFSAARLSVRGRLRSHDTKQLGAFLFRYGSWSIGAVVDERGVTPRFGVGERWLESRSAASE
jgi:hypothetical protein